MVDKTNDDWDKKVDPQTARRFTWEPGDIKVVSVPAKPGEKEGSRLSNEK